MATAIKVKLNSFQKQKYEKPSMKVFELKQQPQLLAGSGNGGINPMGDPTDL